MRLMARSIWPPTNKMFVALCKALNLEELINNEEFSTPRARMINRHSLWEKINQVTCKLPTAVLVEKMNAVGCPCGPIYHVGQAFEDEQAQFLKMQKPVSHPELGEFNLVRSPINLSAFDPGDRFLRPGPALGQHSSEILLEMGMDEKEIATLMASGAVA